MNMFGAAGAAKLPEPLTIVPSLATSRAESSPMDAPALNVQAHTKEQAKVDYHLDLQALEEHTAFPPLSTLLAHSGGGDF